jgi:hypothetical protein
LTDIALGSHFHVLSFSDLTLLFHSFCSVKNLFTT